MIAMILLSDHYDATDPGGQGFTTLPTVLTWGFTILAVAFVVSLIVLAVDWIVRRR